MIKKIGYTLLAFFAIAAGAAALLQSSFFINYVVEKTTRYIEQKTGIRGEIGNATFAFPAELKLKNVKGPGFAIDQLDLTLGLQQLLQGNLVFTQIQINTLSINPDASLPKNASGASSSFACLIDNLQINKIVYKNHVFDLNGLIDFNGHTQSLHGDLDLSYNQFPERPVHFNFACRRVNGEVLASFYLQNKANSITGIAKLNKDASLHVDHFKAVTHKFTAEGEIFLSPSLDLDGTQLQIKTEIHHFTDHLSGAILAQCQLSGNALTPTLEVKAYTPLLYNSLLKTTLTECYSDLHCQWDNQILYASTSLKGLLAKDPFEASGDITWLPHQKLNIRNFKGNHRSLSLLTDLDIDLAAKQIAGEIEGSIEDLKRLEIEAEGTVSFHAQFYLDKDKQQEVEISVHTPELKGRDFAVERASFKGRFINLFDSPKGTLTAFVQKGSLADWSLSNIDFETSTASDSPLWDYTLACAEMGTEDGELQAKGRWGIVNDEAHFHLDSCLGTFKNFPFQLLEPATVRIYPDEIALSPFYLAIAGGTAYTSLEYMPDYIHLVSRISSIPLETLRLVLPAFPATGNLDADVYLYGQPSKLMGQVQMDLTKVHIHENAFENLSDFDAQLVINVLDNSLQCNGRINVGQYHPIEMQSDFPVKIALAPAGLVIDNDLDFNMHFKAEGEISPLMQLLITDTTNISGQTTINLKVFGKIDDPKIQGEAEFTHGTFESPETGAFYKNIYAKLEGDGNKLFLRTLQANDTEQGSITGTGIISIDPANDFPLDLDLEIKNTKLVHLDYIHATGNGRLKLTGNLKEATLAGKIVADDVQASIPEKSQALIHSVEVAYINQSPTEKEPTQVFYKPTVWPIKLDLTLEAANLIAISSHDLDSVWKGGLKVKGTTHRPLLYGEIKLKKGEYEYHGKDFEIREGKITFAGEPDKQTTLYVIASQEIENIRADVILKGPISSPAISFRSNPPMSQREILSWILFGHGTSDLTPFQGSQLTESITNLKTSGSKGPDLFTKFKDKIGIDKFDINHNSDGDDNQVSVRVGKYISKGVLVSIDKSISAEANRLAIEAAVIKDIKVQAEVGDDAAGHLHLKWKKDY